MDRFHRWLLLGGLASVAVVVGLEGRSGLSFAEEIRSASADPVLTPKEQEIREIAVNLYQRGYNEEEIRHRLESQFGGEEVEKASFELKRRGRALTRDEQEQFRGLVEQEEGHSQAISAEEEARFRGALVAERLEKERREKALGEGAPH
jgi:hypothetical protein